MGEDEPGTRPPLWMIICAVGDDFCNEFEEDNGGDPDALEPMFRPFMRTVDLLVRHGARSTRADCVTRSGREDTTLHPWILARPDCTQAIRDAVARGELFHDKHA